MKKFFSGLFGFLSTPWWIKVTTAEPRCIYYFGPYDNEKEATQAQPGFIEDLEQEGAEKIEASLQRSQEPDELTIELPSSSVVAPMPMPV